MKIIVDNMSFSARQGEFISDVAEMIAGISGSNVVVLNRYSTPVKKNIPSLNFPSYSPHRFTADDSVLLQKICDMTKADLFVSIMTTPLSTPFLMIVPDDVKILHKHRRMKMEYDLALKYCTGLCGQSASALKSIVTNEQFRESKSVSSVSEFFGLRNGGVLGINESIVQKNLQFYRDWERYRRIQSEVDTVLWDP